VRAKRKYEGDNSGITSSAEWDCRGKEFVQGLGRPGCHDPRAEERRGGGKEKSSVEVNHERGLEAKD